MLVCVYVRACVHAYVCACVRACVCSCVRFCRSTAAGAVGEEDFRRSFEDCPSLGPLSARAFEEEIVKVEETLLNTDLNWELRATAVRVSCCIRGIKYRTSWYQVSEISASYLYTDVYWC